MCLFVGVSTYTHPSISLYVHMLTQNRCKVCTHVCFCNVHLCVCVHMQYLIPYIHKPSRILVTLMKCMYSSMCRMLLFSLDEKEHMSCLVQIFLSFFKCTPSCLCVMVNRYPPYGPEFYGAQVWNHQQVFYLLNLIHFIHLILIFRVYDICTIAHETRCKRAIC